MFYVDTRLIVRYAETDRMGIVHHSNYPVWFEAGRTEFIKKWGYTYSDIEEKGLMLPLLELKAKYISPAIYEDIIVVRTSVKDFSKTKLIFYYEVYKEENLNKPITTGETMHVWTNTNLKPINLSKVDPELYNTIYHNASCENDNI